MADERTYNDPAGGTPSEVGTQFNTFYYAKKALIELKKEVYFASLADTFSMPKHMGKKIKRYIYVPLLSDANQNDQGIDAAGASVVDEWTINIVNSGGVRYYAVGSNLANAQLAANIEFNKLGVFDTDYATSKAAVEALGWTVTEPAAGVPGSGNLYGSSKDVGAISAKMPALSETGGRVNRVGFKRLEIEGTLEKFGFFDEYTQESMDFDTDAELMTHVNREMLRGAQEITEDALQIDLLNAAGVTRYGGAATSVATISGATGAVSLVTYDDFRRLSIDLDNNRTPKKTKVISGTRMTDTRVINAARIMFIGSELLEQVEDMADKWGNAAFIPVAQYAAGAEILSGEVGTIDKFRIIVVPEMMHWAGVGATEGTNAGYRVTGGNYDVFPMLVVGDESFTTIGFQTDGKSVKFKIKNAKPGSTESYAVDPYGETGFMSIKWYYGFMALRPERIAVIKTVAKW